MSNTLRLMPKPFTDDVDIDVNGHRMILHSDRAVYWPEQEAILIADLHLGKSEHFRKNGIAVPTTLHDNLNTLKELIDYFSASRVIILGDLFHSVYNEAWETVIEFVGEHDDIEFLLIQGNHDILDTSEYNRSGIKCVGPVFEIDNVVLSHDLIDDLPADRYCLHGHIHPGARLIGDGNQRLTLPCFCFGERSGILPAFGKFTGLARLQYRSTDRVFAIAENTVIPL